MVAYASGVVEWLSTEDFRKALRETIKALGIDLVSPNESKARRELIQVIRRELALSKEGTVSDQRPSPPPDQK